MRRKFNIGFCFVSFMFSAGLLSTSTFRTYLKNNLSTHGNVAKRFKMLTYYVYAGMLVDEINYDNRTRCN